jgi:hypothetical protein
VPLTRIALCCLYATLTAGSAFAQGTFSVHFDQSNYNLQPGGTIPVSVVIDPVPGGGLFSYGVSASFDPAGALLGFAGINVPKELDFNGVLGPGASQMITDGTAAVKGTVSFSLVPIQGYSGALLATFLVTDHSGVPGNSTPLTLALYRTLGTSEHVFVDAQGQTLDDKLTFGSATITVIPEPGVLSLLLVGGCCWFYRATHGTNFAQRPERGPVS